MTYFYNLDLLDPGFSQVDLGVSSNASIEEMKAAFDNLLIPASNQFMTTTAFQSLCGLLTTQ